jgi:hypothetical protein
VDRQESTQAKVAEAIRDTGCSPYTSWLMYQKEPGCDFYEISEVDSPEYGRKRARGLLDDEAAVGSYAMLWRAPYDEDRRWQTWTWRRFEAFVKTKGGVEPVTLAEARKHVPPQEGQYACLDKLIKLDGASR